MPDQIFRFDPPEGATRVDVAAFAVPQTVPSAATQEKK